MTDYTGTYRRRHPGRQRRQTTTSRRSPETTSIIALGGNDVMFGDDGDDIFYSGAGSDHLEHGGTGSDTANYDGSLEAVIVDMTTGTVSGGDAQGDVLYSIENVVGTGHADGITGDNVANRLEGGRRQRRAQWPGWRR